MNNQFLHRFYQQGYNKNNYLWQPQYFETSRQLSRKPQRKQELMGPDQSITQTTQLNTPMDHLIIISSSYEDYHQLHQWSNLKKTISIYILESKTQSRMHHHIRLML